MNTSKITKLQLGTLEDFYYSGIYLPESEGWATPYELACQSATVNKLVECGYLEANKDTLETSTQHINHRITSEGRAVLRKVGIF